MRRQAHLIVPLALAWALAGCTGWPATQAPTPSPLPTAAPTAPATQIPTAPPTQAPTLAPTQPPAQPPAQPPTAAPTSALAVAPTAAPPAPTTVPASAGGEVLFLRDASLVAYDLSTAAERTLAEGVSAFAATPDGLRLALVRGQGAAAEIWLLGRDGTGLLQLTANDRVESTLSWSPDGLSVAYTSAADLAPGAPDWQSWGEWCAGAEARVVEVAGGERALAAGCEPAFSPDGRRIAFTTPPMAQADGTSFPGAANTISIVNRQGENGWSVAQSAGAGGDEGLLVHGAAWAPDGGQVAYQRFIGYQALTDINLTEVSSSFERRPQPIGFGAGWLLTPIYAPDSAQVAVIEHNFSDARGFSGYDIWGLTVLRLGGEQQLVLPSATLTLQASTVDTLPRATAADWSPDGAALVVALPRGWRPGLADQEPAFSEAEPGELWLWRPGAPPERKLAEGVDFASPVLWLPPPPPLRAAVPAAPAG